MNAAADRTAGLRAARAAESTTKRSRALSAIETLEAAGGPITAAAVAKTAGVSTWLVYADGVREAFHAARARRSDHNPSPAPATPVRREPITEDSLRTDLAIAHGEIHRLRAEHDKLRKRLRLQLGAEIEAPDHAELITRVASLEATNRKLIAERDARATEADLAQRRVTELEDELTAARESLRRSIRQANR
jgi:hypothetical protein